MKKSLLVILALVLLPVLWYFLIKPFDYTIRVKSTASVGTINQSLKSWGNRLLQNSTVEQQESLNHLIQNITTPEHTYSYDWNLNSKNDSTTAIEIGIRSVENSFINRLKMPFSDTAFEGETKKTVLEFLAILKNHQEQFKIEIKGKKTLAASYCACVSLESKQYQKAYKMMHNFPLLNTVLEQNNIPLNGVPFIAVSDWDSETDTIVYHFCYPIIKTPALPFIKNIVYREFEGGEGIQATYNGNYITSDRAWYALLDYAEKENIEVAAKPIEFFFNNPNMGGDELRWKADIFMPLASTNE